MSATPTPGEGRPLTDAEQDGMPRWDADRLVIEQGWNTPDRCGRCGEVNPAIDALTRERDGWKDKARTAYAAGVEHANDFGDADLWAAEQRATRAEGVVEAARAFIAMGTDAPIHWQIVRRDALTDALATYDQEDSDGQQEEARTHRGS